MKASWSWLRELLPSLQAEPTTVADRLTLAGLEVENLIPFGAGLENTFIVSVVSKAPHPKRDQLQLVTVDTGKGLQTVVCGAPNVPETGGLVVLAPIGTELPAGDKKHPDKKMKIEARPIGGIVSEGMLCSASELGLSTDASGLWVLPAGTAQPGTPLTQAVPSVQDTIFEIGLTPNRPDALGHLGLAREIATLFNIQLELPQNPLVQKTVLGSVSSMIDITIDDEQKCPTYFAGAVTGVTIQPSPLWVQHRLSSLDIRPLNNVIDVTNLMLMELGQPMHAFDMDRIRGGRIAIRAAKHGEQLTTLDDKTISLSTDDLLIADGGGGIALAGVMGGKTSEIQASTQRVLLECAYFNPQTVRRASRRHGIHTESSHRFERGIDHRGQRFALDRALSLIQAWAGGGVVEQSCLIEKNPPKTPAIRWRKARMTQLLGMEIPTSNALNILTKLGCQVSEEKSDQIFTVLPPGFRPDLTREVDLIEEVARVYGYDHIPVEIPAIVPQTPRNTRKTEDRIRQAAVELGLMEARTYSFLSSKELENVHAPPPAVELKNPLSVDRNVMRTSLLPGLFDVLRRSRRHGERSVRMYTLGQTYTATVPGESLPQEHRKFACILAGPRPQYLAPAEDTDVYDAKSIATELFERVTKLRCTVETWNAEERPGYLHPRAAGVIKYQGKTYGTFGQVHPDTTEVNDLDGTAFLVELDVDLLETVGQHTPRAQAIPKLPAISRDISVMVAENTSAQSVAHMIVKHAGELCAGVEIFDRFQGNEGSPVPPGKIALGFHIVYRDPKATAGLEDARTLTDAEVDEQHQRVVQAVQEQLGAILRE
jgi:phenylalanyl-tRNA synthetase beta chain